MHEIEQLRERAAHYHSVAGSCDSIDTRALLKIAQDFDDEAGRVAETKRQAA
ncbi:hypothetical protein [Sphingomonas koreensis]